MHLALAAMTGGNKRIMDIDKMEMGFRLVLEGLGVELDSPHLKESPRRTAEAWRDELCGEVGQPAPEFTPYPIEEGFHTGMIALQRIPVKSLCAHHLLPFLGQATVAFLPDRYYCGLSNLSKVVNHFARRPQLQENLTHDVARFLEQHLNPKGVGVLIQANHTCMEMRDVNHPGLMTTSTLLGEFKTDESLRAEFMTLATSSGTP